MTPKAEPLSETETWQQRDARESAWRKSLKVGDQVLFQHGGYTPWYGGTVERASDNFVTIGSRKFRRRDGRESGRDRYGGAMIVQPLPEHVERIERSRRHDEARWTIERFFRAWSDRRREDGSVTLEVMEAVAAAINAAMPEESSDP